mmetsp:Transcript_1844/g.4194  ORF Transcript_1844/g.4194 Transcript_1844/m.4194 type:complete len:237 (+) Transcript_1844:168-878(+)
MQRLAPWPSAASRAPWAGWEARRDAREQRNPATAWRGGGCVGGARSKGGDGNALRAGAMDGGQLSGAVAQGARTRMPRVCRGGTGDGNDTPPGDRLLHEPRWADDGERSACRGISSRRRAAGRKAVPARAEAAHGRLCYGHGLCAHLPALGAPRVCRRVSWVPGRLRPLPRLFARLGGAIHAAEPLRIHLDCPRRDLCLGDGVPAAAGAVRPGPARGRPRPCLRHGSPLIARVSLK